MAQILSVGRALGRSPDILKISKVLAAYGFPNDPSFSPSVVGPSRWYASTTKTTNLLNFRQAKLRSNLSRVLPEHSAKTSTRYMASNTNKIENLVQNNKVVVFSKSYCPFCVATKNLFKAMNIDAEVLELDQMGKEGAEIQSALFDLTNQRSVPNVFVGGKHLGGNDDTQAAARNGKLQEMLKIN
eukprot:CAMPEP_0197277290 /NCGR_PEP_ID=MMETSP1432-20130617/16883_1 /TAXON_ID=44447 /ORGANISM="Pseudo-nitzschia delicatissima, Strain UNC1205" /LENGTH=184 /DNA_ID=CAMNT_0042743469 /DNA_START=23 /DNA_END=577 /DNA_ORIENTATION=+